MTSSPNRWGGWKLQGRTYELTYQPFADAPAYAYPVDLERFTTSAEVLDMIIQMAEKTWATDEVLAGLVRAINDLLRPQATICSGGRNKTLPPDRIRTLVNQRR